MQPERVRFNLSAWRAIFYRIWGERARIVFAKLRGSKRFCRLSGHAAPQLSRRLGLRGERVWIKKCAL